MMPHHSAYIKQSDCPYSPHVVRSCFIFVPSFAKLSERYQSNRVDMISILKITKGNNSAKRSILTINKISKGDKTAKM